MRAHLTPAAAVVLLLVAAGPASAAVLTAGDVDDHLNWERYLRYVERTTGGQTRSDLPSLDLDDRVTLRILDVDGKPAALARVEVFVPDVDRAPVRIVAGADGVARLFPRHDGLGDATRVEVTVTLPGEPSEARVVDLAALDEARTIELRLENARATPPRALDLMLIVDTTGSMGDELSFLAADLDEIVARVVAEHAQVDIRLGLTLYRDDGDAYVVRALGFASDLAQMRQWLAQQAADGGGDYPEAMDRALASAVAEQWRADALRLALVVADAPPHPEHYDDFLDAVASARERGIRVHSLAGSGVASEAEYLLRAAAVLTHARYAFLTDDSGVGGSHAEPTIACYQVTKLDNLLVRLVSSELGGGRVEPSPQDVLRTVGRIERGVCLASDDVAPPPEQAVSGEASPATGATSDVAYGAPAPTATSATTATRADGIYDADGAGRLEMGEPGGSSPPAVSPASEDKPPSARVPGAPLGLAIALLAFAALSWRRRSA